MEGASEEFIDVYKKMMHMFDCAGSGDRDPDLKDPVRSVYKNFTIESVVAIIRLSSLEEKNLSVAVINRVLTLKLELRFLRTAFRCMVKWCIEDGIQKRFVDILARIQYQFVRANRVLDSYVYNEKFDEVEVVDIDEMVSSVLESIKNMKPEIVENYNLLCSWPRPSKYPMDAADVLEFIGLVMGNLKILLVGSSDAVSSKCKQVLALEEQLNLLFEVIRLTGPHDLRKVWIDAEALVDKVAGFSYFLWIDSEVNKKIEIKLTDPNTQGNYAGILKTLLQFDRHFPDEILKDKALMKVPLRNQIETLRMELEFLKDFSINISILDSKEKLVFDVRMHIKDMGREVASIICSSFNSENMATAISPALSDFLNMEISKPEVSAIFSKVITQEKLKFPTVLPLGFFDFLLEDVKELISTKSDMIIDLKDQILAVHADLELFKPFLQDIKNRPATDAELNEVVNRITTAAYEAEHLINLLIVRACPVWYRSLWVSDLTEEIKLTKAAIVEIIQKTSDGNRIKILLAKVPIMRHLKRLPQVMWWLGSKTKWN